MSKTAKAITFVVISFVIFMVAAALKQSGVGAVMWIAIMAIVILYGAIFKKSNPEQHNDKDLPQNK